MPSTRIPVSEKRRAPRYGVPMAISLEAGERKDRVGIAVDVSASGARFNTASRFEEGDSVTMRFLHKTNPELAMCRAEVVRIERVPVESPFLWRYLASVRFERPLREIEPTLRRSVG